MCGIAGYVDFNTPPQQSILEKMLDSIEYRGPDARGVFCRNKVALGVQRLSIIDLITGDQPIHNEKRTITVVFNGEIYNYRKLRKKLIRLGHRFKTKTDTEVLVHLYELYGIDMPKYLNGMFAFAIWDQKKQELFLARDFAGVKPLYIYQKNNLLIFGSEIKVLLKHPLVHRKINLEALSAYTALGYVPGNSTIFANIYKLPSGTSLLFSKSGVIQKKYWNLPTVNQISVPNIETLLEQSVKRQSIADVPLGIFLSGGIDSSLIAYYLTKIRKKNVETFSVGFANKNYDETGYAQLVANQLHTNHHEVQFSSADMISSFDEICEKLDEPLADPSLFPTFRLAKVARQTVKVVLSGDGGDELFAGYPTYQGHLLAQMLPVLPQSVIYALQKFIKRFPSQSFDSYYPFIQRIGIFLEGLNYSPFQRHLIWTQLLFGNAQLYVQKEYQNYSWMETLLSFLKPLPTDQVTQAQYIDFFTYLPDDLMVKSDRASMFNSLEMRVPFLDKPLIEAAFSISSSKHLNWRITKKILRKLAENKFPSQISQRQKRGFGLPLASWMRDDLQELVEYQLKFSGLYDFLERKKVRAIWKEHKEGKQNHAKQLWTLVMLSGWMRRWLI